MRRLLSWEFARRLLPYFVFFFLGRVIGELLRMQGW
jgi:hypothetical protein